MIGVYSPMYVPIVFIEMSDWLENICTARPRAAREFICSLHTGALICNSTRGCPCVSVCVRVCVSVCRMGDHHQYVSERVAS